MPADGLPTAPVHHRLTIQDTSAWILRIGVILSVAVMLIGTALTFVHRNMSIVDIQHTTFDGRPATLWRGLLEGRGQAVVELGIYLLIFTPIMRVVASMLLFLLEEHDRLYAAVTCGVLILTLAGLLFLR
jgi:uncharacterized membrane protein